MRSDDDNLSQVTSSAAVDRANAEFYSAYPYPWPPMSFPQLEDPNFEMTMLNQSLGDFSLNTVSSGASIWVAGCGTNQAIYTALRFPRATVVGSDLSSKSLELAEQTAKALKLKNLTLRQESINQTDYHQQFDFIVCTGVVHHNADPSAALRQLSKALRSDGVLELMVYNRFHRIFTTAFQKVIRMLGDGHSTIGDQLKLAKLVFETMQSSKSALRPQGDDYRHATDAWIADSLIQPVEYSYTVESLSELALGAGMHLSLPCYSQFDHALDRRWNLKFGSELPQEKLSLMSDVDRWQVANLLLLDLSPMLWFFLRARSAGSNSKFEREVNREFLDRVFERASTRVQNYFRKGPELIYLKSNAVTPYPIPPADMLTKQILDYADGRTPMRKILSQLNVDLENDNDVSDIRVKLTTSACPYLRPV